MVSAMMGGDAATSLDAAARLDRTMPTELVRKFAIMEPVKAAPYTTHARFSAPATILAMPRPDEGMPLVTAMYHYARALAYAAQRDAVGARQEIAALEALARDTDTKRYDEWQVPARAVIDTARLVATGRLADALGDLDAAAAAYEEAVFVEDSLAYMEPPYWYYPVRQSLGSVRLRQGRLDDAEKAFRDSLVRVRNNGWALAGLAATYERKKDIGAEKATRAALQRAWFGSRGGPSIDRL
jgi:tetratricopeptide (TPR) repeat protein